MRIWRFPRVAGVLFAAALVSCGSEPDDLPAWLGEVRARPGVPLEAIPQFQHPESFSYVAAGRRSPFAPLAPGAEDAAKVGAGLGAEDAGGVGAGPGPDLAREREFLEHYSLDALRMVGSLRSEEGLYGLMRTPDGLVHPLATGDYLGRNHGRVIGITEREVQLVELVADGNGGYLARPAAIALVD